MLAAQQKIYPWERTLQPPRVNRGGHRGVEECPCREWSGAGQTGPLVGFLHAVACRRVGQGDVGCAVSVPDFHLTDPGRETENLGI